MPSSCMLAYNCVLSGAPASFCEKPSLLCIQMTQLQTNSLLI